MTGIILEKFDNTPPSPRLIRVCMFRIKLQPLSKLGISRSMPVLRFVLLIIQLLLRRHAEERETWLQTSPSRTGPFGQMKRKITVFVVYISGQRSMRESFFFFFSFRRR